MKKTKLEAAGTKITIELTHEQLEVFKRIGQQLRATPEEIILSSACSYLGTICDDIVEEFSASLLLYAVQKVTPEVGNIWQHQIFSESPAPETAQV